MRSWFHVFCQLPYFLNVFLHVFPIVPVFLPCACVCILFRIIFMFLLMHWCRYVFCYFPGLYWPCKFFKLIPSFLGCVCVSICLLAPLFSNCTRICFSFGLRDFKKCLCSNILCWLCCFLGVFVNVFLMSSMILLDTSVFICFARSAVFFLFVCRCCSNGFHSYWMLSCFHMFC